MTVFDITILIGAICGLTMVIGGIVLLKTGVIKLEHVAPSSGSSDGTSLEILKFIKVQTRYPALGLFVIGLAFVVTAAWISKPTDKAAITLKGEIEAPNPAAIELSVSPQTWLTYHPDNDGNINAVFHPDVQKIAITLKPPPGMDPPDPQAQSFDLPKDRIISLKRIKFIKVADKPAAPATTAASTDLQSQAAENVHAKSLPVTIISLPKDVTIEKLESKKAF